MQRKSGSPAEMFSPLALGHSGAFRCALFPFSRSSRREPARALPINVAKTAKASLDMTAAAVDAAPFLALQRGLLRGTASHLRVDDNHRRRCNQRGGDIDAPVEY